MMFVCRSLWGSIFWGVLAVAAPPSSFQDLTAPWPQCTLKTASSAPTAVLLVEQLLEIHEAFAGCNEAHYLLFGTLIGVLRDGGINKLENDNDLGIFETPSRCFIREMQKRGMVMFAASNTLIRPHMQVCKRCKEPLCATSSSNAAGYTDLYLLPFVRHYIKEREWPTLNPYQIADTYRNVSCFGTTMPIPTDATKILDIIYGDWHTPASTHGNENRILRLFKHLLMIALALLCITVCINIRLRYYFFNRPFGGHPPQAIQKKILCAIRETAQIVRYCV